MPADAVSAIAAALPGRAFIRQDRRNAVFLHWRVPAAQVAPLLPPGTVPDEYDGSSWVGLIPFELRRTAFPPLPAVPWLGTFLETNVRLYSVDERGRRGVVFLTLQAQHLLPVLAANVGLGLPYRWARMRSRRTDDELGYASRAVGGGPRTRIRVRLGSRHAEPDGLAAFLTARWGMHVARAGRTRYFRNRHDPWALRDAELLELDDELLGAHGFPGLADRAPESVLFSRGVTTRFSLPARDPARVR